MIFQRQGNLFNYIHEAYGHGVSTTGKMGRGIALDFKQTFPGLFTEYHQLCREGKLIPGESFLYKGTEQPYIFNLITQDSLEGAEKSYLTKSVRQMHEQSLLYEITDIAIPEIGCGLGGLQLDDLTEALYPFAMDSSHHVSIYSMPPNAPWNP